MPCPGAVKGKMEWRGPTLLLFPYKLFLFSLLKDGNSGSRGFTWFNNFNLSDSKVTDVEKNERVLKLLG